MKTTYLMCESVFPRLALVNLETLTLRLKLRKFWRGKWGSQFIMSGLLMIFTAAWKSRQHKRGCQLIRLWSGCCFNISHTLKMIHPMINEIIKY